MKVKDFFATYLSLDINSINNSYFYTSMWLDPLELYITRWNFYKI